MQFQVWPRWKGGRPGHTGAEGVGVIVRDGVTDAVTDDDDVLEAVGNGVPLRVADAVMLAVVDAVTDAVWVTVVDGVPVLLSDGVPLGVCEGVPVDDTDAVPVTVRVGVMLSDGVPVTVTEGLAELLGVPVLDMLWVGVCVGAELALAVGVAA